MKEQKKSPMLGGTHADNPFQKARLTAGLTQEEAAAKLFCASRTIQRYESGKNFPHYTMLCSMMNCYQCKAEDLFPGVSRLDHETGGDAK